nr:zinc finger, CCHC-type [Tanacetum cinerariifolium]
MRDKNPIHTLGDYSKPSHEGYRNTIELLIGNNMAPLRSDTIRLVQNGCSFYRLWSEDPNQHLKDFLKLMDSLDDPSSHRGDNDANDDGDDLSEDDADDEDEEESSNSEEEKEEHLALTVPAPALYSFVSASEETEPFEEGETAATPPSFGYRVAARIFVQPHILMPFHSESEIRPTLTIADKRRADDKLIGRLRRERQYFHTLATTYAQEVAHSRDYCTQIMDYCQSREVHTKTLVTQIEALQRDVSTLQRQHIDDEDRLSMHIQHKHAQRDVAPEDGDSCS